MKAEHSTKSLEIYSSQTRQTRTALIATSATLFACAFLGEFEANPKIPPFNYIVTVDTLFGILFITSAYLFISFYISAKQERNYFDCIKALPDISDLFIECKCSVKKYSYNIIKELNQQRDILLKISLKYDDLIKSGWDGFSIELEQSKFKGCDPMITLRHLLALIHSLPHHPYPPPTFEQRETNLVTIGKRIKEIEDLSDSFSKQCDTWIEEIDRKEKNISGLNNIRTSYLDYFFPMIFAAAMITGSAIAKICDANISDVNIKQGPAITAHP